METEILKLKKLNKKLGFLQGRDLPIFNSKITIDDHLVTDGYGACFIKYCTCKGWKPNNPKNNYCKNCGHHWSQHY